MPHSTQLPGPQGNWLTGNVAELKRDRLAFFTRCAREFGDASTFRLGPHRLVMAAHPDDIERVLVTENRKFQKHYVLHLLRPMLGNGLLLSEGKFWLRQRRLMQPAFGAKSIEAYAPSMVDNADRLLSQWNDGQEVDLHQEMERLALWIAMKTLLNVEPSDELREISAASTLLMEDFNRRFETALPIPTWVPTPHNLRVHRARRRLNEIVLDIIAKRRAEGDGGDLLSRLIKARDEDDGQGMNDRQLRDEVMTIFLAGHETTANALTWTWWLLASHPQAAAKLSAELDEVLGGRAPTAADLPRLRYTEAVIKESMRLYPPAFVVGRQAVEPFQLGGRTLPVGSTVLLCQWVTHRDERWWDDAPVFNPDRWTEEMERRLPKFAYFPFGGGPRVCIGNNFAMMETILLVAAIAARWRFELSPGQSVEPWPAVTLRPKGGVRATAHRRSVAAPH
ncbi:MAG: cytochrome P450 [Pirellulaceae bacterium]